MDKILDIYRIFTGYIPVNLFSIKQIKYIKIFQVYFIKNQRFSNFFEILHLYFIIQILQFCQDFIDRDGDQGWE